jgi:GTP-binding protein
MTMDRSLKQDTACITETRASTKRMSFGTRRNSSLFAVLAWMVSAGCEVTKVSAFTLLPSPGLQRRQQRGSRVMALPLLWSSASPNDDGFADDEAPSESKSSSAASGSSGAGDDFSFFDEASIYVRAGSGGQGSSTYKKAKKGQNGIPDGGAGGLGGNIILQLDDSLNTLAGLSKRALRPNAFGGGGGAASSKRLGHKSINERLLSFRAQDGLPGGRMYDNGRSGEDCYVRVPPGTVVSYEFERQGDDDDEGDVQSIDEIPTEEDDIKDDDDDREESVAVEYDLREVGTLTAENPTLMVARGGTGGDGTASNKGKKGKKRSSPVGGERFRLRLTLKIVADVALVGVPNAGKSTFLGSVTKATPKIADYPFTTVVPNLGVWIPGETTSTNYYEKSSSNESQQGKGGAAGSAGLVLCDVPGLIAGAADGVGLGHAFLRHVERCRVILHLVDATSDDPLGDYTMVNEEIRKYGTGNLAKMPQVVVVNKIDALEQQAQNEEDGKRARKELEEKLKSGMSHSRLMWMSAKERDGVDDLMQRMANYVDKVKEMQDVEAAKVYTET